MIQVDNDSRAFYRESYDLIFSWEQLTWLSLCEINGKNNKKLYLGDSANKVCRFCNLTFEQVSFRLEAHALPQALGNNYLFSHYECYVCNKFFGDGIENDFGNWSKPLRTFQQISGKKGVPTLKDDVRGWRIEGDGNGHFDVKHRGTDRVFTASDDGRIEFNLKRDPYVPMGVLKAFVKMGLSLMPGEEMHSFDEAIHWILNPSHQEEFDLVAPVFRTFRPGPTRKGWLAVSILRRKPGNDRLPYAFLILDCGNETFQIVLPSPKNDQFQNEDAISIPPLRALIRTEYGELSGGYLDLSGTHKVVGELASYGFQFQDVQKVDMSAG